MGQAKRTYALPSETVRRFEHEVAPGKRSAKVAELIADWICERERVALRQDIIEGCLEMSDVYLEMADEWKPLEEEVACAFDE